MLPEEVEKLKREFGDRDFKGKDVALAIGKKDGVGMGGAEIKFLRNRGLIKATMGGYQFVNGTETQTQVQSVSHPLSTPAPVTAPSMLRVGGMYLHERMLLLADTVYEKDGLTIYTTIIEVDPATKHPRNKRIVLLKERDKAEYRAVLAWLENMAGEMPQAADDTALELAADLEKQLNAANAEIASLRERIKKIQAVFSEATV